MFQRKNTDYIRKRNRAYFFKKKKENILKLKNCDLKDEQK